MNSSAKTTCSKIFQKMSSHERNKLDPAAVIDESTLKLIEKLCIKLAKNFLDPGLAEYSSTRKEFIKNSKNFLPVLRANNEFVKYWFHFNCLTSHISVKYYKYKTQYYNKYKTNWTFIRTIFHNTNNNYYTYVKNKNLAHI